MHARLRRPLAAAFAFAHLKFFGDRFRNRVHGTGAVYADLSAIGGRGAERDRSRDRGDGVGDVVVLVERQLELVAVGDQLSEPLRVHLGMTREAAGARVTELLESVTLGGWAAQPGVRTVQETVEEV